jgi:hypothetical protein
LHEPRILAVLLAATLATPVCQGTEPVATVDRVSPLLPEDGAVTGPRTLFEIGYDTLGEPHPRDLRFRIRLDPLRDDGSRHVFDQRKSRSGWLVGEPGRMLYRPTRPLADGAYRWNVAVWNGVEWVTHARPFKLKIDSVPPADVEDLSVERDTPEGRALIEWSPVTLDRNGRPEFVSLYHIYRYERGSPVRRVRVHEIATVEEPRFVDSDPRAIREPLLFYRVTAEDEAGNEGGPD